MPLETGWRVMGRPGGGVSIVGACGCWIGGGVEEEVMVLRKAVDKWLESGVNIGSSK